MNGSVCVCVFVRSLSLKEFVDELRSFSQVRVSMNNERVSSGQILCFGLFSLYLPPFCG